MGCDSLLLKFLRMEEKKGAGLGKLSGNEIDAFNASGHVYFADSGVSALADRVTYSREDAILQILGTDDADVELFDQRNGFTYLTGRKFTWNPRTKRITAHQSHGSAPLTRFSHQFFRWRQRRLKWWAFLNGASTLR